jgi:amino acid transporter
MTLRELLFGKPLRSDAEPQERIGPAEGIPLLGLDALASASYGPEAALTILLVAGDAGSRWIVPVSLCLIGLLLIVYVSYRQTIGAYPNGGGSFTVAHENLGELAGLVAASALAVDYILNAAVAISAGVGAVVSAIPALLPHTLPLCLAVLVLLTLINMRGVRSAGLAFMGPAYLFVLTLGGTIAIGLVRQFFGGSADAMKDAVVPQEAGAAGVGLWLFLRAFASGCTAMTGVEAVSNGVPVFREPTVALARRTLSLIVGILVLLLGGLALLVWSYGITATQPGQPGYQSVVSQVVEATLGRGAFYYLTMTAVLMVLALSANTSFADFPRVCRVLASHRYLPPEFARRGSRLVFTNGILTLSVLAALLLMVFGGVTDHLIPLFAVGALLAFTMSQLGMVAHWRKAGRGAGGMKVAINAIGALSTAAALAIVVVSKFTHGAWITVLVIPGFVLLFQQMKRYNDRLGEITRASGPLDVGRLLPPIVVIPLRRLDLVGRKALRFALTITRDVHVVQILAEELDTDDLEAQWGEVIDEPLRGTGVPPPRLVVLRSPYRQFHQRLLRWLHELTAVNSDRQIIVLIPELVQRRWYQFVVGHRALRLRAMLLLEGGPQISVMSTPWYPDVRAARLHAAERRRRAMRSVAGREDLGEPGRDGTRAPQPVSRIEEG